MSDGSATASSGAACVHADEASSGAATADTAHSGNCALSSVRRRPTALHPSPSFIAPSVRAVAVCPLAVIAVWSAGGRRSAHSGGWRFSGRRANPDQRPILTALHFDDIYLHHALTHHTRGRWAQLVALSSQRRCALRALPCAPSAQRSVAPLIGQPTRVGCCSLECPPTRCRGASSDHDAGRGAALMHWGCRLSTSRDPWRGTASPSASQTTDGRFWWIDPVTLFSVCSCIRYRRRDGPSCAYGWQMWHRLTAELSSISTFDQPHRSESAAAVRIGWLDD